jgi:hypothetical protein
MTMPVPTPDQAALMLCGLILFSLIIGFIFGRICGHYEVLENDTSVRHLELYHDFLGRLTGHKITREIYPGYTYDPPADKSEESP